MKSYFKRFIVVCFTLIIIFVNISSFYYVAYADNQSSGGHFGSNTDLTPFNKLYDGFDFSDTIAKHESFYFSDSVGNKHAVARVGSAWICLFGSRATFNGTQDEQLNYYLSNQSSETLVFSRKIGILILVPYVFSLVFALMSRNKGNFLFRFPRPPYQAVLRKFVSLPS